MSLIGVGRDKELALRDECVALTWDELRASMNRGANALLAARSPSDTAPVAVFAKNSVEAVLIYLIGLRAGVPTVPLNFHLTAGEVAYILTDARVNMLFVCPDTLERGLEAAATAGVKDVVGWRTNTRGAMDFASWLAGADESEPSRVLMPRAHLHYTSGTTGQPKGVETPPNMFPACSTVGELFQALAATAAKMALPGPGLAVSPLYHTSPLRAVRELAGGISLVTMERFDPECVLAAIAEHRVTNIHMTPTHFVRLLALREDLRARYDLSSLRVIRHTGAACPIHVKRAMIEWLGPILVEVYGATESGPVTSIMSDEWLARPGSVGRTLPQFEAEVYSESGERLGANQEGVLYFRDKTGRGVIYHNDAEKTARAHRSPGVFTLGEIGRIDTDGYVYITDRIADMIVSGGVNIYPAEVEKVLLQHPAVIDVGVVGVPEAEMGQSVHALVVAQIDAGALLGKELDAFCRGRLAGYKCPRKYAFVSDLGRNVLGKLEKRALRDRYVLEG